MNPNGRPSSYKPTFATQAGKLCALGATDVDLADFFEVSIRTIHGWKARYPEFLHSLKGSKEVADERVERSLYQRALGYTHDAVKIFPPKDGEDAVLVPYQEHLPPDTTACIFWLKNRKQAEWRDKIETLVSGNPEAPIKFSIAIDRVNSVDSDAEKPE